MHTYASASKRAISLLTIISLVLSFLPAQAIAEDLQERAAEQEGSYQEISLSEGETSGGVASGDVDTTDEPETTEEEDSVTTVTDDAKTISPDETTQADQADLNDPDTEDDTQKEASASTEEGVERADGQEGAEQEKAEPQDDIELVAESDPSVEYSTHVQKKGWMPYVSDGKTSGTQGQSLRMEALKIRLANLPEGVSGGVRYRMHVQRRGWLDWAQDNELGGTQGNSLRVESMRVELYGNVKDQYDIYYRVHAQHFGWMGWAKNGAVAGTAGKSLRLEAVQIELVPKSGPAPTTDGQNTAAAFIGGRGLTVSAHSQRVGWQQAVGNKGVAGTVGRSLRLEAVRVKLEGLEVSGDIRGRAHVQGVGWKGWVNGGDIVGTVGKGRRAEAFVFELTGEASQTYDLYYRVHVARLGWMGWAKEGEYAGSEGMSLRVEAVQMAMVKEGQPGPTDKGNVDETYLTASGISYAASVQGSGWQSERSNGAVAGTTGQSKRLEAIRARISGGTVGGGVSYRLHKAGSGWSSWASDGADTATQGNSKPVEAMELKVTGRAAKVYNVWYRVHLQGVGWLGWAANGQTAGAPGLGRRVEAYQVRLVPKGNGAPGSTANHVLDKSYFSDPMTKKAQGYASRTNWLVMVDCTINKVGIYTGSRGHWQRTDLVTVATGAPYAGGGDKTIKGVFQVNGRGYSFGGGSYTCYYWTRIYGDWLFHSILYRAGTFNVLDGRLGVKVSHGCVRMPLDKAKWIHDNIPDGTTVVTY